MKKHIFLWVLSAMNLANAETYYWTGAANDGNLTATPGNWSLTSGGSAAQSAPGSGDTVIFENHEALTLTKSKDLKYLKYEFRGADVSLPKGSNRRQYGYGGGGITATGTGSYVFGYPLELEANQEDKTFVVDVASGATVSINETGTLKVPSPVNFIKRGAGKFSCGSISPASQVSTPGKVTLEAGTLRGGNDNPKLHVFGEFEVTGTTSKTYEIYASSQKIIKYVETPEASKTLTINTTGGAANDYDIQLTGPYDVPRFSADLKISESGVDNHFKWNPEGGTNTITMVDRVWDASAITISVLGGTMRFADGAGILNIKALNVESGAKLVITASASMMFSGAPIVLKEGARLKVEGEEMVISPKSLVYDGKAVAEGRYKGGDFSWLDGDGVVVVGSQPMARTYYWAGDDGASFSIAGNWHYANGTTSFETPEKDDAIVFTNETGITVNKSVKGYVNNWSFLGTDVAFNPDSNRYLFYAGGVMNALGSGTISMKHSFELQNEVAGQFAEGDRFTFNIGPNMTISQGGTGTVNLNSPATAVKTGAGVFSGAFNESCSGTLAIQEGTCDISGNGNKEISLGGLLVEGQAVKTVRINARPLKILKYSEDADAEMTCLFSYYGGERTLSLACSEDTRMTADLYAETISGILVVNWVPTTTTATLTYAKRVLDQERTKFLLSSGTLKFAEGGGAKRLKGIEVSSGATLEIAADAYSDFDGVPVTLDEGAMLRLDGETTRLVHISSLTVNGAAIPDGNYTSSDYPAWLEGNATLVVGAGTETAATWTGNGGMDTSIDNPANWGAVGATTLPDLTKGTLVATLPADATLSVPDGKSFSIRGLVLQSGCTIGGAGSLGLGSAGLVITGSGTVTINGTVELLLDQVWELGLGNARLVLETNAEIVSHGHEWNVHTSVEDFRGEDGMCALIKCANPRLNDSSFNFGVHVAANGALGGSTANVKINAGTRPHAALQMSGCALTNGKITISSLGTSSACSSIATDTGACVIEGDLDVGAENYDWLRIADGAPLTVKGKCSGSTENNLIRMAKPALDGYDLTVEKSVLASKFDLSKAGVICFKASANIIRRGTFLSNDDAKIVTAADEAFCFGTDLASVSGVGFGLGGGTWDLFGTHQSVQMLAGVGRGVVTSEQEATLVLDASKKYESDHESKAEAAPTFNLKISDDNKTFTYVDEETAQLTDYVSFQGRVNFEKRGAKVHYQGGISTSTGSLTVSEGTLVFKEGARWRTVSSVNVTGTGVLEVEGSGLLSSATPITVEGDETGRIVIPVGKTLKCKSLSVNGVDVGDGKVVTSGVVTGGGQLQVGKLGYLLMIR